MIVNRDRELLGFSHAAPPAVLAEDYTPLGSETTNKEARERASRRSDLLNFPAAAFEQDDADSSDGCFGDNDGPKNAAGVHAGGDRQVVGQGNFQEPEAEEIHNGGSDGEAPGRQDDENNNTDGDGVAGKGCGAENADDADEADPAGVGDEELQDASERDAQEAKKDAKVDANLATKDADALGAAEQSIELIEHTNAATGEGGEGRAGDAELGKRPPAEDETRVEYEIDDVGDPEQTHGDGGVTRAAEDGVVQEEKHDRSAAAERDAGVAGADRNDLRGSAHRAKQMGPVKETRNAENGRDRESNGDGLNAGNGCAGGGLLPDCTTGHAGGCKCRT